MGTRPIEKPPPNDIKVGPGRRGPGSCGYGEFVVVPSYGPYIHNVTFRNITTYGKESDRKAERVSRTDSRESMNGMKFRASYSIMFEYYGTRIGADSSEYTNWRLCETRTVRRQTTWNKLGDIQ